MIVGFTGTRQGMSVQQQAFLEDILVNLKADELHHGCCVGADDEANTIARSLNIKTEGHPPTDKRLMANCEVDFMHSAKDYLVRNRDIVDACSILLVAPRTRVEVQRGSGTWATYRYANKIGKNTVLLAR